MTFLYKNYIPAAGGAGSSAAPACLIGINIKINAIIIKTEKPINKGGSENMDGILNSAILNGANPSPVNASPAINPDAKSIPTFSILTFCASLNPFFLVNTLLFREKFHF